MKKLISILAISSFLSTFSTGGVQLVTKIKSGISSFVKQEEKPNIEKIADIGVGASQFTTIKFNDNLWFSYDWDDDTGKNNCWLFDSKGKKIQINKRIEQVQSSDKFYNSFVRINDYLAFFVDNNSNSWFISNTGQFTDLEKKASFLPFIRINDHLGFFIDDQGNNFLLNDKSQFIELNHKGVFIPFNDHLGFWQDPYSGSQLPCLLDVSDPFKAVWIYLNKKGTYNGYCQKDRNIFNFVRINDHLGFFSPLYSSFFPHNFLINDKGDFLNTDIVGLLMGGSKITNSNAWTRLRLCYPECQIMINSQGQKGSFDFHNSGKIRKFFNDNTFVADDYVKDQEWGILFNKNSTLNDNLEHVIDLGKKGMFYRINNEWGLFLEVDGFNKKIYFLKNNGCFFDTNIDCKELYSNLYTPLNNNLGLLKNSLVKIVNPSDIKELEDSIKFMPTEKEQIIDTRNRNYQGKLANGNVNFSVDNIHVLEVKIDGIIQKLISGQVLALISTEGFHNIVVKNDLEKDLTYNLYIKTKPLVDVIKSPTGEKINKYVVLDKNKNLIDIMQSDHEVQLQYEDNFVSENTLYKVSDNFVTDDTTKKTIIQNESISSSGIYLIKTLDLIGNTWQQYLIIGDKTIMNYWETAEGKLVEQQALLHKYNDKQLHDLNAEGVQHIIDQYTSGNWDTKLNLKDITDLTFSRILNSKKSYQDLADTILNASEFHGLKLVNPVIKFMNISGKDISNERQISGKFQIQITANYNDSNWTGHTKNIIFNLTYTPTPNTNIGGLSAIVTVAVVVASLIFLSFIWIVSQFKIIPWLRLKKTIKKHNQECKDFESQKKE